MFEDIVIEVSVCEVICFEDSVPERLSTVRGFIRVNEAMGDRLEVCCF